MVRRRPAGTGPQAERDRPSGLCTKGRVAGWSPEEVLDAPSGSECKLRRAEFARRLHARVQELAVEILHGHWVAVAMRLRRWGNALGLAFKFILRLAHARRPPTAAARSDPRPACA
jgi:hypothetical protein